MVMSKTQAQAPARSLDQRMEALRRANDIRVRRAQLKKDLKLGRAVIEQPRVFHDQGFDAATRLGVDHCCTNWFV